MKLTETIYAYPESGVLDSNTYVIRGNPGVIIDPGSAQTLSLLIDDLRKDGIDPKEIGIIANTHLHIDHSWANTAFRQRSGARIVLHPLQKRFYGVTVVETTRYFGLPPVEFQEDFCFDDDRLKVGDTEFRLIPAPGHSPDSICYYCQSEKVLICGDVLFNQNSGRADLPGGSAAALKESIECLSELDIAHLLPGHMDFVSGAELVKGNFEFIREHILPWL